MADILVTSRSFDDGDVDFTEYLTGLGHRVLRGPAHHELTELAEALATADAWIAGTGPVTEQHMAAAPKLRVIARYGVGVEAVDVEAAAARGIVVSNTPGANSDAVADHAVGLILAALRHTVAGDRRVRTGDWSVRRGRQLGAATVGIIGFGRIGQGVARRLSGFGATVLASDPFLGADRITAAGATPASIDDVFERADVISLHAPGGEIVVTQARLGTVRTGTVIVNTARADLVDEATLAQALREGALGFYAADVMHGDTAGNDGPLLAADLADRVVITPHLGAQTSQAVDGMGRIAVQNALAVLASDTPPNPVNAPTNTSPAATTRIPANNTNAPGTDR